MGVGCLGVILGLWCSVVDFVQMVCRGEPSPIASLSSDFCSRIS
jgi:hypothetical protein